MGLHLVCTSLSAVLSILAKEERDLSLRQSCTDGKRGRIAPPSECLSRILRSLEEPPYANRNQSRQESAHSCEHTNDA